MSMLGVARSSVCVHACLCICVHALACMPVPRCMHVHEGECVSKGVYLCSACALLGTGAASDTRRGVEWKHIICSFIHFV